MTYNHGSLANGLMCERKERVMADEHKSRVEQNARRVAGWLAEHGAEFSQGLTKRSWPRRSG